MAQDTDEALALEHDVVEGMNAYVHARIAEAAAALEHQDTTARIRGLFGPTR